MKPERAELEAQIVDMVKKGIIQKEIAEKLNVSITRIYETAKKNGLSKSQSTPAWSKAEIEKMERMFIKDGMTSGEIFRSGAFPGRSKEAIATRCRRVAITAKKPKGNNSTALKKQAEALIAEIPQDTRTKTAFIMGDPIPGRSALDKWKASHRQAA